MPTVLECAPPEAVFQCFVMEEASWEFYENLIAELERSGQHAYVTYDSGALEIMAPLQRHDGRASLIGRLVEMLALELRIHIYSLGSTTWRRKDLLKGLEADKCYYVRHEAQVWDNEDIDLTQGEPPPDLAIEVDVTRSSMNRFPIYAALGVPELWRWEKHSLVFYRLMADGTYQPIVESKSFLGLRSEDLNRFIDLRTAVRENDIILQFIDWVRANLKKNGPSC